MTTCSHRDLCYEEWKEGKEQKRGMKKVFNEYWKDPTKKQKEVLRTSFCPKHI